MTEAVEKFRQQFGVAPDEIDRVTIFVLAPEDFKKRAALDGHYDRQALRPQGGSGRGDAGRQ